MRILLNFLPLKAGGGVQVGLDFLNQVERFGHAHEWYLVASKDTPFANSTEYKLVQPVHFVSPSFISRLNFEYVTASAIYKKLRPDVVYTQFGPHLPIRGSFNIVGCAYSNLFYPEIRFWDGYTKLEQFRRKVIDNLRLRRLNQADVVIFETPILATRAREVLRRHHQKITHVLPAVSSMLTDFDDDPDTAKKCGSIPSGFRIVLLSRYHKNKNFELLVKCAKALRAKGCKKILFVLTLPHDTVETRTLLKLIRDNEAEDFFYNFGAVPYRGCATLYAKCDAAVLPSRLESFSNNIAEAWAMSKPLLISDLDWARSICEEGAMYFRADDGEDMACKILALANGPAIYQKVIALGALQLKKFPTAADRFNQYLSIIESARKDDVSA